MGKTSSEAKSQQKQDDFFAHLKLHDIAVVNSTAFYRRPTPCLYQTGIAGLILLSEKANSRNRSNHLLRHISNHNIEGPDIGPAKFAAMA